MKRILYLAVFVFVCMSAVSQVVVDQRIDTMQIMIGEQTRLTLSVTVGNGKEVKFPEFSRSQYITPGLEILECGKPDTTELDNSRLQISKSYVLTSFDENLYCIPSQKITVGGKPYTTKSLALKVLTVPVDTAHTDKFYPAKGVQDNPFLWSEWAVVLLYSVLFVLLLLLSAYLVYRLRNDKPIVAKVRLVRRIPPHQKAIRSIEQLKSDRAAVSGDQKEYYTRLTEIIRQYIAERFHFDAMEMTSSEIIGRLRSEGNEAISEIANLFRTADLVKFAKHSALVNENDANLMSALTFVNDTKMDEKPQLQVVTPEEKQKKAENNRRLVQKACTAIVVVAAVALLAMTVYRIYVLI